LLAVDYSTVNDNLEIYYNQAAIGAEPVLIKGDDKKNVVMMSLENYDNMMENLFLASNKANYTHILTGINQIEQGVCIKKTKEELEQLLNE